MSKIIEPRSFKNLSGDCSCYVSTSSTQFPMSDKPTEYTYHVSVESGEDCVILDFSEKLSAMQFIELFRKTQ